MTLHTDLRPGAMPDAANKHSPIFSTPRLSRASGRIAARRGLVPFALAFVLMLFAALARAQSTPVSWIAALKGATPSATAPVSTADARRFLEQSSFGLTAAEVLRVQQLGLLAYLQDQFARPASGYPGFVYTNSNSSVGCPPGSPATCSRDNYSLFQLQRKFFVNAVSGADQLRQRVAFALSQILVVSGMKIPLPYAMANYQQVLLNDAFGNFRTLLDDVTLSPAMGRYLDMVNNNVAPPGGATGANENYARELLQLFTLGLVQLNPDGSTKLDANGQAIPSYTQDNIEDFAKVFTGWTFAPLPGQLAKWVDPENYGANMVAIEAHHDQTAKTLLNGFVVPAGGTAASDLKAALDNVFAQPNVGPFICRQLIQHLVTSNPSAAYVQRVAAVFANDGAGVRGNMKAVITQILLDSEARGDSKSDPSFGKLREPALFLAGMLRMMGGTTDGVFPLWQSNAMEQNIFDAPTVFSYYPPGYTLPGSTLSAPPFALFDTASAVLRANVINRLLSGPVAPDPSVSGATGTQIDLTAWQASASSAVMLTNQINQVLFHNTMPLDMALVLMQAINAVPSVDLFNRTRAALYLAFSSAQYQVEQ